VRLWLGYDDEDEDDSTAHGEARHSRRRCLRCWFLVIVLSFVTLGLLAVLVVLVTAGVLAD
jgi:hypothetical protein